ncbi:sigma-54 interaction domain-containing protein [Zhaonella formicivorans]|uniref:sigma-54 interaction domain-containing protein n=1 Tax=Zhaonella formicivorans TaxID=2528593 RepID=UPI0010E19683|nr:sigma 54-interacting transcriptional regulator [Zhaonella formicivorans]
MESQELLIKILQDVLNSIHEGIIVTDRAGKIIFYNNELAKLEDLSPEKVIGKHLGEVYEVGEENSEHLQVIKTGKAIPETRRTYFTSDGKEITIVASAFPVYVGDEIVAVYSVCRDITKIKELLAQTMQLQEQIQQDCRETIRKNGTRYTFDSIIYASSSMHNLIASAKKAAEADCSVLVYGETGTGKELLVQGIHNYSNRSSELFVAINCAAIPETLLESMLFGTVKGAFTGAVDSPGLFEQAGKGTLFLDELNSMSPPLQAKLLRVLQERRVRRLGGSAEIPVGCRIVSSTNVDPWECIRKGQLRKDLFYRLAVISLYIPSLKERVEDIEVLLNHFLNKYQKIYGLGKVKISPELRNVLQNYQWPGNVRELEHVIESAVNMLDGEQVITVDHLPLYLKTKLLSQRSAAKALPKGTLAEVLTQVEKQVILDALEKHNWNITKAADSLGIVRQNLQYRIRKLGINS